MIKEFGWDAWTVSHSVKEVLKIKLKLKQQTVSKSRIALRTPKRYENVDYLHGLSSRRRCSQESKEEWRSGRFEESKLKVWNERESLFSELENWRIAEFCALCICFSCLFWLITIDKKARETRQETRLQLQLQLEVASGVSLAADGVDCHSRSRSRSQCWSWSWSSSCLPQGGNIFARKWRFSLSAAAATAAISWLSTLDSRFSICLRLNTLRLGNLFNYKQQNVPIPLLLMQLLQLLQLRLPLPLPGMQSEVFNTPSSITHTPHATVWRLDSTLPDQLASLKHLIGKLCLWYATSWSCNCSVIKIKVAGSQKKKEFAARDGYR